MLYSSDDDEMQKINGKRGQTKVQVSVELTFLTGILSCYRI
jgi:hypothetical protein